MSTALLSTEEQASTTTSAANEVLRPSSTNTPRTDFYDLIGNMALKNRRQRSGNPTPSE